MPSVTDLQTTVKQVVCTSFTNANYHFGDKVIGDVMVDWANYCASNKAEANLTFEPRYHTRHLLTPANTTALRIDTPVYAHETEGHHILRNLTKEWSYRYWTHLGSVRQEKAERFQKPISPEDTPKAVKDKILEILKTLSVDDGLDFMAMLIVEWATRFNTEGFLQMIQDLGYTPTPEAIADETFVVVTVLWFMDMNFQLA